jgi:arginase
VDVLDDEIMPAVDYRMKGGMSFTELSKLIKILLKSGRAVGMDLTIFNPNLDQTGEISHKLVKCLAEGFSTSSNNSLKDT